LRTSKVAPTERSTLRVSSTKRYKLTLKANFETNYFLYRLKG
jgi:hypothetical protein